jgi:hypothetical protein
MCDNIETIIYFFIDSFYIENRYVIVVYYVTLLVSLLLNYLSHHSTSYVTHIMSSLNVAAA